MHLYMHSNTLVDKNYAIVISNF